MGQELNKAWVSRHPLLVYLIWPLLLSGLLMALYFSGQPALQAVVAPTMAGLEPYSWREFGLLEQMQNLYLLCTAILLIFCLRVSAPWLIRLFLFGLLVASLFILLEEIDYGIHYANWFSGHTGSLDPEQWNRNLHNRTVGDGVQLGSYMKLVANVMVLLGLIVLPLIPRAKLPRLLQAVQATRWIALTALLMIFLSLLAHRLDDAGLAVINGVEGNLHNNISEFRELNLYYLLLIYVAELTDRLRSAMSAVQASSVQWAAR